MADFEVALGETRASVTPEMLEEYDRIQETLKSEATRPLGGIGFVLPGMLRPKPGRKANKLAAARRNLPFVADVSCQQRNVGTCQAAAHLPTLRPSPSQTEHPCRLHPRAR